MEHAENLDVAIGGKEVGDAVVAVEENPDVRLLSVAVTDLRKGQQDLGSFVDREDRSVGCVLVVGGDVVVNLLKPALASAVQTICATTRASFASPHG
jgi:hypothetical protein